MLLKDLCYLVEYKSQKVTGMTLSASKTHKGAAYMAFNDCVGRRKMKDHYFAAKKYMNNRIGKRNTRKIILIVIFPKQ